MPFIQKCIGMLACIAVFLVLDRFMNSPASTLLSKVRIHIALISQNNLNRVRYSSQQLRAELRVVCGTFQIKESEDRFGFELSYITPDT